MTVSCNCDHCKHWSIEAGDYALEGGCTLDAIEINDKMTGGGWIPSCMNYKEDEDVHC